MPFQIAPIALGQEEFKDSSVPVHELGALAHGKGGRKFRYVKAGGATLVAGNCIQAPAQVANHYGCAVAANAAIGDLLVNVTLGNTLATANQYAGGQLVVDTTPGEGYAYQISANTAAAGNGAIVVTLSEPLQIALTSAGSKVTLVPNPYNMVIQAPVTTLTGAVVGVAVYPITTLYFGWVQVGGPAPVLIAGTPAVGYAVSCPSTAAGAAAINSGTLPIIGNMMVTGVDGKILPVFLTIA
jgi:hypothetical protein